MQAGPVTDGLPVLATTPELRSHGFQKIDVHLGDHRHIRLVGQGTSAYWVVVLWAHMPKAHAKQTLARNLAGLMEANPQNIGTQLKLAKKAGIDQKTVSRVLRQEQAATVDVLDALASACGVEAWQLLVPDFDPATMPRLAVPGTTKKFYDRVAELAKELGVEE